MAVIRIVPSGTNVIGSGQVDDGAGSAVTEAIIRAFDNKAYPNTSGKLDITNVRRPDTSSGLSVYGWEVDTTANFTVDMKFSWVAGTYVIGIILCGDTERDAYLAYTLTNVFNTVDPTHPVQSWVLASQPDGVANGNGPGALPGDGLLVTGDIVKLRLSGTGHATNPVLTFSMRREQSDTTLIYDYTNLAGLTAVNLKDWYTLWSLATDGCRAGIFADGGFGVNASIPITEFKVTATKRTPAALPSTPIHYGVIGDSITTMLPATANTRQKLVVPAAMDLALVSLTNYNWHENLKGNGRSFATSADIINSATYVGLNSSALEIAIIMIGTNDGNQKLT